MTLQAEYGQRIADPFNAILSTQFTVFNRDRNRGILTDLDIMALMAQWKVIRF